ncbi:MAG TPA: ACT domain-containing protein [Lachnospiraceae bacterium]|jgi:ACT domain-containing protein|nr:ACT domain-containing protein [Lachnospiraceae bacterium]MDD6148797.1 ACT domain-containing protein [Lachnospiraceae bacterium]MDY5704520.1 ACT domain-containing protein [Lachnospiraceae bacterium]MEE3358015.1 ACT domain-containing protein [Lachnospiraceae bacterium]HAN51418.1 ACT domain-containing protein [Lachnospiraceae bacterium]
MEQKAQKTIITVVGKDTVGIIAKVCTYLSNEGINVNDITQTILQGYFNMMMIVDMSGCKKAFDEVQADLKAIGDDIGVEIKAQRSEIFDMMHRI